jgi:hypothetical protein
MTGDHIERDKVVPGAVIGAVGVVWLVVEHGP